MGKIFKEVIIFGSKSHKKLLALFDTGATYNYIGYTFRDNSSIYDLGIIEYKEPLLVIFANNTESEGQMIKLKSLHITKDKVINEPTFCLFDLKLCDIIIGAKLMQELKIALNPSIKEVQFV